MTRRGSKRALAWIAAAGCGHAAPLAADHPADPRAPIGRLAAPPVTLAPGVVSYGEAPAAPTGHEGHAMPPAPATPTGHEGHTMPPAPTAHEGHAMPPAAAGHEGHAMPPAPTGHEGHAMPPAPADATAPPAHVHHP